MQMTTLLLNATLVLVGGYAAGKLAERILGILLCALAVQTMLNGASELGIITLKTAGHG